jgi:hypothetical protein
VTATLVVGATVVAFGSLVGGELELLGPELDVEGAEVELLVEPPDPGAVVRTVVDVDVAVVDVVPTTVVTDGRVSGPASAPLHAAITNTLPESNSPPARLHIGPTVASARRGVTSAPEAAMRSSRCERRASAPGRSFICTIR